MLPPVLYSYVNLAIPLLLTPYGHVYSGQCAKLYICNLALYRIH